MDSGVNFNKITSRNQWWEWNEQVLIPSLLSKRNLSHADSTEVGEKLHVIRDSNLVIGGVRIAQRRAVESKGEYCYNASFDTIFVSFISEFYARELNCSRMSVQAW